MAQNNLELDYELEVRPWLELAEVLKALSLDNALSVPQVFSYFANK